MDRQVRDDTRQALIGASDRRQHPPTAYAAALNGTLDAAVPLVDRQDDSTNGRITSPALHYRDGRPLRPRSRLVVAAVQFRAKIAGTRSPAGEVARRTLAGIRKEGRERGRGQATSGHL